MAVTPIPTVETIDKVEWRPHEYPLLYHFVNFSRMANAVNMEPGPLQGWFSEALWRHYSYAPFNARVMENYYSLAFFYGYEAPWNVYYKHPDVLERLRLTLEYTFNLMAENGAIPEYASADLDTPMLAPSSFGMEYMAGALAVAGTLLPADLRGRLAAQARKAATYVLTSEESWDHARSYTNQFLGAMAGGARLARLTGDTELQGLVDRAGEALLAEDNFMSPMGFLYEADGPESFAYFFVTLHRLIPLYHEWPDRRVLEVLRRHCAWMSRWMLLEPDGETLILAGSHQTRTASGYRVATRSQSGLGDLLTTADPAPRTQNGLADLMVDGLDERRFIKLFLTTAEEEAARQQAWTAEPDPVAAAQEQGLKKGYPPVSTLALYDMYTPPAAEVAEARRSLPYLDRTEFWEEEADDRGNQYVFVRFPAYYTALAFGTRRSQAQFGPAFLWHTDGGTLILSENGDRPCWETQVGTARTGKTLANGEARSGRGGVEVAVNYADLGLRKMYVFKRDGIDVLLSGGWQDSRGLVERIPLFLRKDDVIYLDYGRCVAGGMSDRPLGVVTQTAGIERGGKRLLTVDFGAPVSATLTPTYDADGYVRVALLFPPARIFFSRTGYRLRIG